MGTAAGNSPSYARGWAQPTGAPANRAAGYHPVYTPPQSIPGERPGVPVPGDEKGYHDFLYRVMCCVAADCLYMSEPFPTVDLGFRHQVVPNLYGRGIVVTTGTVAGTDLFESATVLALANGIPTFTIGNLDLVAFQIPPGFGGVLRGWGVELLNGGPSVTDLGVSVVTSGSGASGLSKAVPETFTFPDGLPPRDRSTWLILKENQNISLLARTTSTVTPYILNGWLDIWIWPLGRGSPDSQADLVLASGRRSCSG